MVRAAGRSGRAGRELGRCGGLCRKSRSWLDGWDFGCAGSPAGRPEAGSSGCAGSWRVRVFCRVMRLWGCCATISTSMPIAHILADTSTESPPEDEVPAPLAGTAHPSRTAHLIPARPHHTPPRPVPNPRISEGNRHFHPGTRRKNRKHTACSLTSPGKGRRKKREDRGNGKEKGQRTQRRRTSEKRKAG